MSTEPTDSPAPADRRTDAEPPPAETAVEPPTSSELWRRVEEIFQSAVLLERTDERRAWVDEQCGDDARLQLEVDRLLAADRRASGSLEEALVGGLELFSASGQPPPSDDAGRRIGPYRVVRTLGEGGMGKVLLAARADREFEQLVALKLIRPGMGSDRIIERFRRERQILANLVHPNIAHLLDGGTTEEGLPYLVMEHIEGEPIDRYCDARRLGIGERLELFDTVCEAVAYAHRNLIIHRDLKPANILVTPEGTVKLLDFGIAKLLSPEEAGLTGSHDLTSFERPLTPGYASPEQVAGSWVSTASDVYSLGVVLYQLLSGRRPYRTHGLPPREAERRVLEEEPPLPSSAVRTPPTAEESTSAETIARRRGTRPEALVRRLSGDLDNILLKALEKEPARRYPTIEPLARDLDNHRVGLPVSARQATLTYRASKMLLRHRVAAAVAAAFLLVLIAAGIGLHHQAQVAARERDTAETVVAFMMELFELADPDEARGEQITAQELLDRGADRLGARLEGEPTLRARLLDTVGQVYHELGLYRSALPLLEEALALRREELGEHHQEVAESLSHLGDSLWKQGELPAAEAAYRDALALWQRLPGDNRNDRAGAENGLGLVYREQGRLEEAAPRLEAALELYRAVGGERTEEVAAVLGNLGLVLDSQGRFEEAEPLLRRALTIDRALLGEPHPAVASDLQGLAIVRFHLGDYAGAERLYRQTLEMRRAVLDPRHPNLQRTISSFAAVLYRNGDYAASEELFHEALEIRRQTLGPRHPEVANSLNNLAVVLENRGDYAASEPLFREALEIRREAFGERHPRVAKSLQNLAKVRLSQGDTESAEPLLAESLAMLEELLGADHPDLVTGYARSAELRRAQGRLDEAVALQRRAVEISVVARGEEHPETAAVRAELAALLLARGELAEADALYRQAIATQRELLPPQHPDLATSLTGQGEVLLAGVRASEAEPMLREALAIRRQRLDPDDWRIGETQSVLGGALAALGRPAEAAPLLRQGHTTLAAARGTEHPATLAAAKRLAALRFPT